MLNSQEILQRLFFIDKYSEEEVKNKSQIEIKEIFQRIKKECSLLTIQEVENKLSNSDLCWFNRLKNKVISTNPH